MANEEAFFVIVGVDEPTGDAFSTIAAYFAGVGMEHVHAVDLNLAAFRVKNVDVWLAEDDEQIEIAVATFIGDTHRTLLVLRHH